MIYKHIKSIIIIIIGVLGPSSSVFAASYVPLEKIPGTSQTADLPQYVSAIYKFGIWGIGIAAFLMITIGGFMYMTSAGNNARMNSAKEVISDSLWGLVVAMLAWLLLYIINPDFVSGRLNFRNVPQAAPSTVGAPGVISSQVYANCKDPKLQKTIEDAVKVVSDTKIDKCLLEATAYRESTCGQNVSTKLSGDVGVMQIKPSTAGQYCSGISSSQLFDDRQNILCSAMINKAFANNALVRKSSKELFIKDMAAFYRGGAAMVGPSQDCPGMKAYECTINDGRSLGVAGAWHVRQTAQSTWDYYRQCAGI